MPEEVNEDFSCYNPHSNPTGDVPPVHYKIYMCDWKGKTPKVFYGTWNLVSAPVGLCYDYPLAPTAVEFTRTTKDCEQTSFYTAASRSPLPPVPFAVAIIDPLVYEYRTFPEQANDGLEIIGDAISGPTGDTPTGVNCSATTFTMSQNFNNMDCKFHIEITGISF
jgi:hypothetical protein